MHRRNAVKSALLFLAIGFVAWCARPFSTDAGKWGEAVLLIHLLSAQRIVPTHLYVADGTGMYAMQIDAGTGALFNRTGPFGAGNAPTGIVTSTDNRALFVGSSTANQGMYAFSLATPSNPTPVAGSPFDAGISLSGLSINSRNLYATPGSSQVRAYNINTASGALTLVSGSPFGVGCVSRIQVDPQSRFIFTNDGIANLTQSYPLTPSGAIVTGSMTSVSGFGSSMATDSEGKRLFVNVPGGSIPNMRVFDINQSTGVLTAASGSPYSLTGGVINVGQIAVDPRGRFVYILNTTGSGIFGFHMNNSGSLTPISSTALATVTTPTSLHITADGGFIYTATGTGTSIAGFRINNDGTLTMVTTMTGVGAGNVGISSRFELQ